MRFNGNSSCGAGSVFPLKAAVIFGGFYFSSSPDYRNILVRVLVTLFGGALEGFDGGWDTLGLSFRDVAPALINEGQRDEPRCDRFIPPIFREGVFI